MEKNFANIIKLFIMKTNNYINLLSNNLASGCTDINNEL